MVRRTQRRRGFLCVCSIWLRKGNTVPGAFIPKHDTRSWNWCLHNHFRERREFNFSSTPAPRVPGYHYCRCRSSQKHQSYSKNIKFQLKIKRMNQGLYPGSPDVSATCLNAYCFKVIHSSKAHVFGSLEKLRSFSSCKISRQQHSWEHAMKPS